MTTASMKNVSLFVMTGACLLLGVIVFLQQASLREARAESARALVARDAAKHQSDEIGLRLASAEKNRRQAEEELKNRPETPAPAKPAAPKGRGRDMGGMAMLNNPGMQKMMATMARSGLDQRYGPLFRKLKLSPADLAKLKDQLIEKQMSGLDVLQAAQAQGGAAADEKVLTEVMGGVQGELDANIHSLLGDAGFKQFEDFNKNAGSYGLLDQVERRLGYTNSPLQTTQSDALMRVLSETAKAPDSTGEMGKNPMSSLMQGMAGGNPMVAAMTEPRITETTITAAEKVLTPTQVEVLRQLQTEQEERATSFQAMRGLMGGGGSGGAKAK
jgi:hypothetical protein